MHRPRSTLAAALAAALSLPLTLSLGVANATPPPDDPVVQHSDGLDRPAGALERLEALDPAGDVIAESMLLAEGHVTAFVELATTAGVDAAEAGDDPAEAAEETTALAEEVVPDAVEDVGTFSTRASSDTPTRLAVTTTLVAGMVVDGDAARIRALAGSEGVEAIHLITPKVPNNKGADVFTRAAQAWESTGMTGQDVTIGVIDTGIDYTHAAFGGPGTAEAYAEAYGEDGTGPVPTHLLDDTKYLGGWDFAGPDYNADPNATAPGATTVPSPNANPIDAPDASPNGGHGTHVAATAAGYGVLPDGSTFDGDYAAIDDLDEWRVGPGSAPEAGVYALKVFGDNGGSTALTIQALEWAADPDGDHDYNDRLDIVNLSLGSVGTPADDPENLFIDRLANLGTLAVTSAGNSGDVTDIGGTPGNARSTLTVANSVGASQTYDAVEVLEAPGSDLEGLHPAQNTVFYTGTEDVTAPVVHVGDDVTGCTSLEQYREAIEDAIVWLWWDDDGTSRACGSVARWNNAAQAGAAGVLIGTTEPVFSAGIAGNEDIPGAQLTAGATQTLLPAIREGGVVMRMGPSLDNAAFVTDEDLADLIAQSSSRGVHGSLGVVKPDVAAPGTLISSASSGSGTAASTKTGTSMSAPHVAGIAALVAEANPGWTPQQIKTAIMNTATHDVYGQPGQAGPVQGPERVGSGRVDALDAVTTDVLAWATDDAELVSVVFGVVHVGQETLEERRTVTVRNTGSSARTFTTSFDGATTAGGAQISVHPATVTVPAGRTALVTVTLTVDPETLAREIDPTSEESYDLGIDIPREFVSSVSGRLVLTPEDGDELRVPVHAAPRPVSDLTARTVTVREGSTSAPLRLDGAGVQADGWRSHVAPLVHAVSSPRLDATPGVSTSPSSVAAGDLRHVGYASTAPQLAAAGGDPATGTLGIGLTTDGPWTRLGVAVIPIINVDIDGDGIWDLEAYVRKLSTDLDVTVLETYALDFADGSYSQGALLDVMPVDGLWGDPTGTVFDNDVLVAPMTLDAVGIAPGDTPSVTVATFSRWAPDGSNIVDEVPPFDVDPFDPPLWFDSGDGAERLWFPSDAGTPLTVHRAEQAEDVDQQLLVLHALNEPGARAQLVDVVTGPVTPTTTDLAVEGDPTTGTVTLVASVDPDDATGTVTFLRGEETLGEQAVDGGEARLEVELPPGTHEVVAAFEPDDDAWTGSRSEPVTVEVPEPGEVPDLAASRLTAVVPGASPRGLPLPVAATVRTDGPTPTGRIEVKVGDRLLGSARVVAHGRTGAAALAIPSSALPPGEHVLTVTYTGNDEVEGSSVERRVRVIALGPLRP
ncbi:S8 family serine peptidase [Cellulomonas bogoriensis]|uniref:Peptidase S8 n=1 Tax=Cellulomonas bogoriensis 69B4 = DSM 16987 TaxID=1386082 RepID=A0A0A0C217_9CELL|nr:S8 family serine peptidase [Cellulomonas bogoriensis]KGM13439.1 peptidase S8 [Cellulomonas bogoriensis 69B4 = DSM 16987]